MKKIFLTVVMVLLFNPVVYAEDSTDTITFLTQKGFFDSKPKASSLNPRIEIKKALCSHLRYANSYKLEELKSLYDEDYKNADGLNKDIYFELIKKTWDAYPDIKYKMDVRNIEINEDRAVVQVRETAVATTSAESGIVKQKGLLESISDSVYYFEKIHNEWLITSDYILFEKTFLRYGSAKDVEVSLSSPALIEANTQYTATLNLKPQKDTFVIASIGRENITYPQKPAKEVFRKLPEDGILERVLKSNDKNINEYAVASYGITQAEFSEKEQIKIRVTGLGFVMVRVNVFPKNKFVKAGKDENNEQVE